MLAWLTINAVWAFFFSSLISNSIPMMNIKRINPIWLRNWRLGREVAGKRNVENAGKKRPIRDGPKKIPAIISPITAGCPILPSSHPKSRPVEIMESICRINIDKGCCRLWNNSLNIEPVSFLGISNTSVMPLLISRVFPC